MLYIGHLASSAIVSLEAGITSRTIQSSFTPLSSGPGGISISKGNERTNIRVIHLVSPVFTTFLKQGSSPENPMHVSKIPSQRILDDHTTHGETYVFRNISTPLDRWVDIGLVDDCPRAAFSEGTSWSHGFFSPQKSAPRFRSEIVIVVMLLSCQKQVLDLICREKYPVIRKFRGMRNRNWWVSMHASWCALLRG